MKTLHLNVTKKWFKKIASGEKVIEYRLVSPHWKARLQHPDGSFKKFDRIVFRNGYATYAPEVIKGHICTHILFDQTPIAPIGTPVYAILLSEKR